MINMNTWNDVMQEVQTTKRQTPEGRIIFDIDGVRRKKMEAVK